MKKGLITAKKNDIYEKDIYVINVKQVYNDLHQRIEQEIIKNAGKGKEILELLESEFKFYCSKIKIKKKLLYALDLKQYELTVQTAKRFVKDKSYMAVGNRKP